MSGVDKLAALRQFAQEIANATGAEHAVVIIERGDVLLVGAWVPSLDRVTEVLRGALEQLETGEAVHVNPDPASRS